MDRLHLRDDAGMSGVVNVEVVDRDDEAETAVAPGTRISRDAFDTGAPNRDALPGTQHCAAVDLLCRLAAGNDYRVRTAQLFNVGERTVFVVVVTDQDRVGRARNAGDAPGVDVDEWVAEDGEAAMSQPLDLIDHKTHFRYCRTIAGQGERCNSSAKIDLVKSRYNEENSLSVSYTHLRAHETDSYLVCRL